MKMYEDVGMAECQNPVKLGGCMQARQGWWHNYNKMFNHRDPTPERCRDWGHDG